MTEFVVVIPARYASSRLPGKVLHELNGRPMLQHVYERGKESCATDVIVATDDARIADAAESFGATVCMTDTRHRSGTERIAEVADVFEWADEQIVVNLQGDEPSMPAQLIDQCAALLASADADLSTLASPFRSRADFDSPNCVKVLCDINQRAIYFSRAAIPYRRDTDDASGVPDCALHHHGMYGYRCGVLRTLVAAPASPAEIAEQLEQLRALHLGMSIVVGVPVARPGSGVDVADDIGRAEAELQRYSR